MTVKTKKQKRLAARRGSAKRIVVAASGIALGLAIAITVAAQQIGGRGNDQPNNWQPASTVNQDTGLSSGGSFVPENRASQLGTTQQTTSTFVPSVPSSASIIDPRSQAGQGFNQPNSFGQQNGQVITQSPRVANVPYGSTDSRTFQLRNLSIDEFESALLKTWGPNLQAQTRNYGRQVRVLLPNRSNQHAEMIIDREKGQLQFFGPDALVSAWRRAMSFLDVSNENQEQMSNLVNVGKAKPETIKKAINLLASHQEEAQNNQQDNQSNIVGNLQDDRIPRVIYQGDFQQGQDGENQGNVDLDRPVQVEFIEELGVFIVRGNPEDAKKVIAVINQISLAAQATQPEIRIFKLSYSNSQSMRDTLQQLYDQIYLTKFGTISISAISSPNSIMVIGRKEAVDTIEKLIESLDRVSPDPGEAFKTYRLRFMSAPDAKIRLDEYFGAQQNQAFAPAAQPQQQTAQPVAPVLVIADYRSNSIVVKASPREIVIVDELLKALDVDGGTDGSGASHVVEVIPLKNAVAGDLAQVIQDAINGGLQNAPFGNNPSAQGQFGNQQQFQQQQFNQQTGQGGSQIPARSLSLMMVDQEGKTVRSGLTFDIRVSSDPNSNSIIVTGPEQSMNLIKTLVNQLDRLPSAETQLKVFQIVNGQAELMLQAIQSLFGGQGQQFGQFGAGGFGQNQGTLSQLPLQSGNATEGTTLVNLRFGVDTRTNSILVSGPIGDLKVIEDLITRLDEQDFRTRRISVYRLNNLSATDMATAVNDFLDGRRNLNDLDPGLSSPYDQADREIIVIPEPVSNSLIISATPRYYPTVEGMIRALDRRPPMVKVKVTIAEVQLSALKEIGFEYGVQDSLVFDRGIGNIGFPFNQSGIGNNSDALSLGTREDLAGQGLLNLSVGRTNSDLGYGGLVLTAGNESISVLMRMLKDRQAVRVLSTPHITTVDNLTANVIVGADVPRVSGVTQSNFGVTNNVESIQVGIILQVTPRVNPDGSVIMDIDVTNSSVGPESQGIPIFVSPNGDVVRSPQINLTQAQSTILAQSGQTVMFGGLITETKSEVQRGVPFFSDIPAVGQLFRYNQDAKERRELLIIMTPYIIESPEEVTLYNQVEMDRMHWCEADVVEHHGSLNSNCNDFLQFDHSRPQIIFPDRQPTVDRIEDAVELSNSQGSYERGFDDQQRNFGSPVVQPATNQRTNSIRGRDSSIPIGTSMPNSFNSPSSSSTSGSYEIDAQGNRQWQGANDGSYREQSVFENRR